MKETLRHKEAFEYYYSLGENRSYQKVADHFHTSKKTVYTWSINFGWQERVQQRDMEIARQIEKKTTTAVVDEKAKYRTIIGAAMQDFVERVRKKELVVDSVLDFERLVKLDLLLMGEPTERNEEKGEIKHEHSLIHQLETDEESRELFKQLYRRRTASHKSPRTD